MFLDMDEFCRALLSKRPSVAEITWESPQALRSFLRAVGPALRRHCRDTVLAMLSGEGLEGESFQRVLVEWLDKRNASRRCLVVYQIESLLSAAGAVLNGFRERLGRLRAVVVVIRENRHRDFVAACPDVMDWVGHNVGRAEDLGPPFTLRDVNTAIRALEKRFRMTSAEFREKWIRGELEPSDDLSVWGQLLGLRTTLESKAKR